MRVQHACPCCRLQLNPLCYNAGPKILHLNCMLYSSWIKPVVDHILCGGNWVGVNAHLYHPVYKSVAGTFTVCSNRDPTWYVLLSHVRLKRLQQLSKLATDAQLCLITFFLNLLYFIHKSRQAFTTLWRLRHGCLSLVPEKQELRTIPSLYEGAIIFSMLRGEAIHLPVGNTWNTLCEGFLTGRCEGNLNFGLETQRFVSTYDADDSNRTQDHKTQGRSDEKRQIMELQRAFWL